MTKGKLLGFAALFLIATLILFNLPSKKEREAAAAPEPVETVVVEEEPVVEEVVYVEEVVPVLTEQQPKALQPISDDSVLPSDVDRMGQLFNPYPPTLPIVETVSYAGRVDWLTGRAAYLGDYASHHKTSKHFISRSLHGMGNYLSDLVSKGDRFNVIRTDREIEFHLVLDLSRLKMWVYSLDKTAGERMLLKSYPVCAGRLDESRRSGSLTPFGTYKLGEEIAVYRPGAMGTYKSQAKEMISVFGVRWIPFRREIANCTAAAKGLGIHGNPWRKDPKTGEMIEQRDSIGSYQSNGCVRLLTEDIEELFSVIVSRPSYIHIVRDFTEAKLPGLEKS